MQAIKHETLSSVVENIRATPRELPFKSEQAWMFSLNYMASYMVEHANNSAGFSHDNTAMMAAGRLDWLLRETRPSLSGLFSEADVIALLDCYLGDIFFPDEMRCLASDLCNHLGIEVDDYETSSIAPLVDKLRGLNALQRLTLADALEQTWCRGMQMEGKEPKDFLASMGIALT